MDEWLCYPTEVLQASTVAIRYFALATNPKSSDEGLPPLMMLIVTMSTLTQIATIVPDTVLELARTQSAYGP